MNAGLSSSGRIELAALEALTLVLTAELLEILDVLTLDRRGFSTFRTSEGNAFRLVLDAY